MVSASTPARFRLGSARGVGISTTETAERRALASSTGLRLEGAVLSSGPNGFFRSKSDS
jgi:hypothetical protein